jgi:pimeloyl-ACP methyl ester carboxylesterase
MTVVTSPRFVPTWQLYPFQSRWLNSSAGRVHYIDEGQGLPILFLHGNPTWSFLYRNIIIQLRDRYRCVAIDYPGFGLSDRPDDYGYTPGEHAEVTGELVRDLDLRRMLVVGHDWGGPIAAWVAAQDERRVAGLVFGNTWLWPNDRLTTTIFSRVMSSPPMERRILNANYFVERLIPAGTSRKLTEEEMNHYRKAQPAPEFRRGVAELPRQLVAAARWLSHVEDITRRNLADKPVLLAWGMRDIAMPKKYISRFLSMFIDVEVMELPKAKHFIQEDAPERVADAIARRFVV